jgi:hypothetical protein
MSYILIGDSHPWRRTASFMSAVFALVGILGAAGGTWMIVNENTSGGILLVAISSLFLCCAFVIGNLVRTSVQHDAESDRVAATKDINDRIDRIYDHISEREEEMYRKIADEKREVGGDIEGVYRTIERIEDRLSTLKK